MSAGEEMGRAPCCDEEGLKKGPWSPEEDRKLVDFIQRNGHGSWRALPKRAGLNRCGKSCRLRWANYLSPDIKMDNFSEEEERLIIHLHSVLGNKWSAMATRLPGRTDNAIKNHWNTHLRKRLLRMGVDPVTHRPRVELGILANLPGLLAATNLGNLGAAPWGDALRVQADAAQLARIQSLQSLVQAIASNLPPASIDLAGLVGSSAAWLWTQQSSTGDLLQGIRPPPALFHSSLPGITTNTSGLVTGSSISGHVQLLAQSLAHGEGRAVSLPVADLSSTSTAIPTAADNSFSENQGSSSSVTAASTPSLASASPLENPTMDPVLQDMVGPTEDTLADFSAEAFEPWGVLAQAHCDYHWEDMIDVIG